MNTTETYAVAFGFTTITFGAKADINKPIGIAVANHFKAVAQIMLQWMHDALVSMMFDLYLFSLSLATYSLFNR